MLKKRIMIFEITVYNNIMLCSLILYFLINLCLTNIQTDPTWVEDEDPLLPVVKNKRRGYDLSFIQQMPFWIMEIPLSLELKYEINKTYIDISSNKLIIPKVITDIMILTKIMLNDNQEISIWKWRRYNP